MAYTRENVALFAFGLDFGFLHFDLFMPCNYTRALYRTIQQYFFIGERGQFFRLRGVDWFS